jgi:hypothetical protein
MAPLRRFLQRELGIYPDGEQITYQKRGRTWIAVSGYWGIKSFTGEAISLAVAHSGITSSSAIPRRTRREWMHPSPEWPRHDRLFY